jgi:hypothetical protein
MTAQDITLMALTSWRENRQAGTSGLTSIINVILNRSAKTGDSPYLVCTQHAQFSSISMPGPEAYLWPVESDPQWQTALSLASQGASGALGDITGGSTLYYAPYSLQNAASITLPNGNRVPFPAGWNAADVRYQATIGGQMFFTEV